MTKNDGELRRAKEGTSSLFLRPKLTLLVTPLCFNALLCQECGTGWVLLDTIHGTRRKETMIQT